MSEKFDCKKGNHVVVCKEKKYSNGALRGYCEQHKCFLWKKEKENSGWLG